MPRFDILHRRIDLDGFEQVLRSDQGQEGFAWAGLEKKTHFDGVEEHNTDLPALHR